MVSYDVYVTPNRVLRCAAWTAVSLRPLTLLEVAPATTPESGLESRTEELSMVCGFGGVRGVQVFQCCHVWRAYDRVQ
jgi:hypothetical protein